jgi:hypothetical protein
VHVSNKREMDAVVREARERGLEVTRRANNHWRILAPSDGRYIVVGSTPGSGGAVLRARSHVGKLVRGEPIPSASVDLHRRRA